MTAPDPFLFFTCQRGAEGALKQEIARQHPAWRFAFSRPGFLTFKVPSRDADQPWTSSLVFARAGGRCLGKVTAASLAERAQEFWQLADSLPATRLQVFHRDLAEVGYHGYLPASGPAAQEADAAIRAARPASHPPLEETAPEPDQLILDCVLVEPDQWWVGYHQGVERASLWTGGVPPIALPDDAVSRAWLKIREAILWSRFYLRPGDVWAEIGCAPGGASQALLELDQKVLGIDPADIDPRVAEHRNFMHVRKRGSDLKRRDFAQVRFLAVDMNVAPRYTLDTVEDIVTHQAVNIMGLLLTIKLPDWNLAADIPEMLQRVRDWGYPDVRARQLAFNRQEICIAAARDQTLFRKTSARKTKGLRARPRPHRSQE